MRISFRRVVFTLLALIALAVPPEVRADGLTVFAAASLKNAIDDIADAWKAAGGAPVAASYASSSTLAKQIEQGAPADVFISADEQWMSYLAARMLVTPPHDLLTNRLVLISAKANPIDIDIEPGMDLVTPLAGGRLAVGDPSNVPAGIYAKEALQKLGVWSAVEPHLAPAADVRAALVLVSRGEVPLGIVYETDALVDPGVRIAGIFPEESHTPIRYPVAAVASRISPDGARFIAFLDSPTARAIFKRYGFGTAGAG
jgi:molybdate transport system substrate-binding protein